MRHSLIALLFLLLFIVLPPEVYTPLQVASEPPPPAAASGRLRPSPAFPPLQRAAEAPLNAAPDPASRHGNRRALHHASARLLAGPGDLSPDDFGAYGVLAFARAPHVPTDSADPEAARAAIICEAFVSALAHRAERPWQAAPPSARVVVTVWPMQTSAAAERASAAPPEGICPIALQRYRMETADLAIRAATGNGQLGPARRGPFLMAWQPGAGFADPGRPILFDDLSDVTDAETARARLAQWDRDIARESRYSQMLAERLGLLSYLRLQLRKWADDQGADALRAVKATLRLGTGDDA